MTNSTIKIFIAAAFSVILCSCGAATNAIPETPLDVAGSGGGQSKSAESRSVQPLDFIDQELDILIGAGERIISKENFEFQETGVEGVRVKIYNQDTNSFSSKCYTTLINNDNQISLIEQDYSQLRAREKERKFLRHGKVAGNGAEKLSSRNDSDTVEAYVWINTPLLEEAYQISDVKENLRHALDNAKEDAQTALAGRDIEIRSSSFSSIPLIRIRTTAAKLKNLSDLDIIDSIYYIDPENKNNMPLLHGVDTTMNSGYVTSNTQSLHTSTTYCSDYTCDGTNVKVGVMDGLIFETDDYLNTPINVHYQTSSPPGASSHHAYDQLFIIDNTYGTSFSPNCPNMYFTGAFMQCFDATVCQSKCVNSCGSDSVCIANCPTQCSIWLTDDESKNECMHDWGSQGQAEYFVDDIAWFSNNSVSIVDMPIGLESVYDDQTPEMCNYNYSPSIYSRILDYYATVSPKITFIIANGNTPLSSSDGSFDPLCFATGQKSYNTVKVAASIRQNFDPQNPDPDALRVAASFVWKNGTTNVRELPDIASPMIAEAAAPLENEAGGTSFSAPSLTGIAASVTEVSPSNLSNNPPALKAVLMAGAHHDVDHLGFPLYTTGSLYDRRGGVGSADALASAKIAENHYSIGSTVAPAGFHQHDFSETRFSSSTSLYESPFSISRSGNKRRLRIALAWNVQVGADPDYGETLTDLDLLLYRVDSGETLVAESASISNNWEFIEYIIPDDSVYKIRIRKDGAMTGTSHLGLAWYLYEHPWDTADDDGDGWSNYYDNSPHFPKSFLPFKLDNGVMTFYINRWSASMFPNADFELGTMTKWGAGGDTSTSINPFINPKRLLSFWTFDDFNSTTIYDKQGNLNLTLTTTGEPRQFVQSSEYLSQGLIDPNYGASYHGHGMFYTGGNPHYLHTASGQSDTVYNFNGTSNAFSLEAVVKSHELNCIRSIIKKRSGNYGWHLWIDNENHINFRTGSHAVETGDIINSTLKAYHIVASYIVSGGTMRLKIFVNGQLIEESNSSGSGISATTEPLTIGEPSNNSAYSMLYVRIYNQNTTSDIAMQLWKTFDQERRGFVRHHFAGIDTPAFGQPIYGDMVKCRNSSLQSKHQGDYWSSTYDNMWASDSETTICGSASNDYSDILSNGDTAKGWIESPVLFKPSSAIGFGWLQNGSGNNPSDAYVEFAACSLQWICNPWCHYGTVCNAWGNPNNVIVRKSDAPSETLSFKYLPVADGDFNMFKFRVHDNSSSQHIGVDDFRYICSSEWCGCGHDRVCGN